MKSRVGKPALEGAAEHLRALALSVPPGTFVGAEDSLITTLGVSRVTVRQAARLLEREGVLRVRRGANGGYFSARPNVQTIEGVLGGYLDTQSLDLEETFILGLAIWEEVVRQVARLQTPEARFTIQRLRARLEALSLDAPLLEVMSFENDYRASLFHLAKRPYLELMFQINRGVTWRYFQQPPLGDATAPSPDFVADWRDAKLMELTAIEQGKEDSLIPAAIRSHKLWQSRLLARVPERKL